MGFNTASGRYCCNAIMSGDTTIVNALVSIPQAVGTVATSNDRLLSFVAPISVSIPQAVGTVATVKSFLYVIICSKFQYRKR